MEFDVLIVGAGPAGLAAAIRLRQLSQEKNRDISVCVLEKGSEVGAHILSGAVLNPCALTQLLPDWEKQGAPVRTAVEEDRFLILSADRAFKLPVPPQMRNDGNYIISLGNLCRWLASKAESLGVEIFPGFAASDILYDSKGNMRGVLTGNMGIGRDGKPTSRIEPGIELLAGQTLVAEGCRGSLARRLIDRYQLAIDAQPQTYGIGLKELWDIDPALHQPGLVIHTVGWPLQSDTYGGSFLYHLENNQVAVGFVVGLDYSNPYLNPFAEFQQFKTHPEIRDVFKGGRRVSYGARALSEGGLQSLPELAFPGGVLVGDTAGFLNVPSIKGIHTAMYSGIIAAEAVFDALDREAGYTLTGYTNRLKESPVWQELDRARNIRPAFRWGLWAGLVYSAMDTYLLRGRAPWTLGHKADHAQLRKAADSQVIDYPKPDGKLTFDLLSSVQLSGTRHESDQPVHLHLKDPSLAISVNLADYDAPELYYCPAGVYEIVSEDGNPRLQINAENCIHCKTCDIKDPGQNIIWTVPEGGGGPNYPNM